MSQRTVEKEFDVLKGDLMNLFETVANNFKQKAGNVQDRGEQVVEDIKDSLEQHPKATALVGGSIMFGLGLLTARLLSGRNRR